MKTIEQQKEQIHHLMDNLSHEQLKMLETLLNQIRHESRALLKTGSLLCEADYGQNGENKVKTVLKGHYHAGLTMLAECVDKCPDDLWTAANLSPSPPAGVNNPPWNGVERPFWRIAFHNAYFTHLYLGQDETAFQPPPAELAVRCRKDFEPMWHAPWELEPYELPTGTQPCSQSGILEYIEYVDSLVDSTVAGLDLESRESGFHWYPNTNKLSHQLINLRHLQGHVGQLSELLMARGIDIDWVS